MAPFRFWVFGFVVLRIVFVFAKHELSSSSFEAKMVGAVRLELTTSCTPYKCASQLRYAPKTVLIFDFVPHTLACPDTPTLWPGQASALANPDVC